MNNDFFKTLFQLKELSVFIICCLSICRCLMIKSLIQKNLKHMTFLARIFHFYRLGEFLMFLLVNYRYNFVTKTSKIHIISILILTQSIIKSRKLLQLYCSTKCWISLKETILNDLLYGWTFNYCFWNNTCHILYKWEKTK